MLKKSIKFLSKAVLSMALLLSATLSAVAKTVEAGDSLTATRVLADIPLEVLDMLRVSARLDMIDYYEQLDSLHMVNDALGGNSRLETVAPDYLKLSVTPVSTLEIKILPYKKRDIVMTLYTTGGEGIAKDTEVAFFDADLRPLPVDKFLKRPDIADFFNLKESDISEKELKDILPFMAVEYSIGSEETPLRASLTTQEVLSEETKEILTPILKSSLTAEWKDKFRF